MLYNVNKVISNELFKYWIEFYFRRINQFVSEYTLWYT